MNDVSEPLGEQVLGGQARPAHVVDGDGRDTVEALFARQNEDGREALTRFNRNVDRRVLASQDNDAVDVEGSEIVAQLPVRPVRVGHGHVVPRLRRGVEDRQQHAPMSVEHGGGQDDLQDVGALGRERSRRVVGYVAQLLDELRNARASLFRHLGIPAHDARDRVGRDACPPRDVGERDLLSCGSGRGHGLLHWLR